MGFPTFHHWSVTLSLSTLNDALGCCISTIWIHFLSTFSSPPLNGNTVHCDISRFTLPIKQETRTTLAYSIRHEVAYCFRYLNVKTEVSSKYAFHFILIIDGFYLNFFSRYLRWGLLVEIASWQ